MIEACNIFAICQKRREDKVDFLHAGKHLQIDTINIGGHHPRFPKITSLQNLCNTSRKK